MNLRLILVIVLFPIITMAQVGINTDSPHESSVLEIYSKNKGVLIPRLLTSERDAIQKPAHSLMIYNVNKDCIEVNQGGDNADGVTPSADDAIWKCLVADGPVTKFFYAPSVPVSLSSLTPQTVDLYAEYAAMFGTPMVSSEPTGIAVYAKTDLNYHILNYDTSVLSNVSIDANGIMTYTPLVTKAYGCSYINVVFEVK